MTSLELALVQGAVLILIAPVCAAIGATLITAIKQKTWVMPWLAYRRENSVPAAIAFGAAVTFAVFLPLLGFEGFAGTDGNTFVLIALLAVVGGGVMVMDTASLMPKALCAIGTSFLALAVATSSVNGSYVLRATSGDARPAIVLAVVALGLALIALRNADTSVRSRDVSVILQAALGVFLVNLVAMIAAGNLLTSTVPALNALILAGKALGAAIVIGVFAAGAQRHALTRPNRLVLGATFLSILSIIVTLWPFNA